MQSSAAGALWLAMTAPAGPHRWRAGTRLLQTGHTPIAPSWILSTCLVLLSVYQFILGSIQRS